MDMCFGLKEVSVAFRLVFGTQSVYNGRAAKEAHKEGYVRR